MFAPTSATPKNFKARVRAAPAQSGEMAQRRAMSNQAYLQRLASRRETPALKIDRADSPLERQASLFAAKPDVRPTAAVDEPGHDVAPAPVHDVLRQPGTPLDPATRRSLEPALGRSLSDVRLHTGLEAANAAASVKARAFTVGPAIVFGAGRYAPGTRETAHLLAHELAHTVQHDRLPPRLSREAAAGPLPAAATAQPDPQAFYLDDATRADWIGDTRLRLGLAFTAFGNACTAYRDAIKNEAKARAEVFSTVIDIATGFLAPAFASVGTKIAERAAAKAAVGANAAANAGKVLGLISQTDKFKATFTGASKVATLAIKSNATPLFGETDLDAFASKLRDAFQAAAATLSTSLGSLDDNQVCALWAAFDPTFANETAYRAALKGVFERFRAQVEPIGSVSQASRVLYSREDTRAVWMDAYGKLRLALVRDVTLARGYGGSQSRQFVLWVSEDMVAAATTVTEQRFKKVETIDPGSIANHIPDPNQP